MSKKKEKCNPLIIIIIALVITIAVILSMVIALRFVNRDKDSEVLNPEKLVKKEEKGTDNNKTEGVIRNVCETPECITLAHQLIFNKDLKTTNLEVLRGIQKIGAWPMMDPKWDGSKFDLNGMLVNMAKMGRINFGLFRINLSSSKTVLLIPGGGLDFEEEVIHNLLSAAKIKFDQDQISEDFEKVMTFSQELDDLKEDIDDSFLSLIRLKSSLKSIDFDGILKSFVDSAGGNLESFKKGLESPNVEVFFGKKKNLESLLKSTPPSTIANFLIFHYIQSAITFMDLETAREQDCADVVIQFLPQATLRHFVHNFFDRQNVKLASKMIDSLKESYIEAFKSSTWINEKSKETAIKKVETMTKLVAYPEEKQWEEDVEKLHKKLIIKSTDTLFTIYNKVMKSRLENVVKGIGTADKNFFQMDNVMEVNAYYTPLMNHVEIMIVFLDEPLFDSTFPKYARFSKIGSILAHEIGHGFDTTGATLDEHGKPRNWWQISDKKEYDKRVDCLIDQYENYDDPDYGKKLNGSLVIDELAADQWGAEVNWKTHRKAKMAGEQDIIGFEGHDTDKMYFYISALEFCAPPKNPKSLIPIDDHTHPTSSFRVNGVFSNLKHFAETFNCPVGAPMNPVKKCEMF